MRPRNSNGSFVSACLRVVTTSVTPRDPFLHRYAEQLEFLVHVAARNEDVQASSADEIDDGHVFGKPERVMKRSDHGGEIEAHVGRAGGHGGGDGQRAREVAVFGPVVLGDDDADGTKPIGPLGHLDARLVPVGHMHPGEGRIPEVEAEREHSCHLLLMGTSSGCTVGSSTPSVFGTPPTLSLRTVVRRVTGAARCSTLRHDSPDPPGLTWQIEDHFTSGLVPLHSWMPCARTELAAVGSLIGRLGQGQG